MLRALELDGYMQMSVSKFRERFLAQTDTPEYQDLLRRLSEHTDLRFFLLSSGDNPDAVFYFDIVENLTGEDWEFRSYEGSAATSFSGENETPMFRYTFSLAVTDPDLLTVEAYDQARIGYHTILDGFLSGLNPGSSLSSPDEDAIRERLAILKKELAVFRPYGLSWQCLNNGELRMFFEGKEVRGIFDTEQDTWISAHTGNSAYGDDAIDLYTVYENGKFRGLRFATEEESALWDEIRSSTAPDSGAEGSS